MICRKVYFGFQKLYVKLLIFEPLFNITNTIFIYSIITWWVSFLSIVAGTPFYSEFNIWEFFFLICSNLYSFKINLIIKTVVRFVFRFPGWIIVLFIIGFEHFCFTLGKWVIFNLNYSFLQQTLPASSSMLHINFDILFAFFIKCYPLPHFWGTFSFAF